MQTRICLMLVLNGETQMLFNFMSRLDFKFKTGNLNM